MAVSWRAMKWTAKTMSSMAKPRLMASAGRCWVAREPMAAPGTLTAANAATTIQSMWPSAQWVAMVGTRGR